MKQEAVLSFNQKNFQIENNDHPQIDIEIAQKNQEIDEDQNRANQSQEYISQSYATRFAGYLGYGSKGWAAVWETLVFGLITLILTIALAFITKASTKLALNQCLMISNFIVSSTICVLIFKLHGQYNLKRHRGVMLGDLRDPQLHKKLIGFCFGFVLIMFVPVVILLYKETNSSTQDVMEKFVFAFMVEIIVATCGHLMANFNESEQQVANDYQDNHNQSQAVINNTSRMDMQRNRQVVVPLVAYFRDSVRFSMHMIQITVLISLVYVPLIVGNERGLKIFSLQSYGYWDSSCIEQCMIYFKNVIVKGLYPKNYWQTYNNQNVKVDSFQNDNNAPQHIQKTFIDSNSYCQENEVLQFSRQYLNTQKQSWMALSGKRIQAFCYDNKSFEKIQVYDSNGSVITPQLYKTNEDYFIYGKTIVDSQSNQSILANAEFIYKQKLGGSNHQKIMYEFLAPFSLVNNTIDLIDPTGIITYDHVSGQFKTINQANITVNRMFIDQKKISTAILQNDLKTNQSRILATLTHEFSSNSDNGNHYLQWAKQASFQNDTIIDTYQHELKFNNKTQFWIQFHLICIVIVSLLSTVFNYVWKSCSEQKRVYLKKDEDEKVDEENYRWEFDEENYRCEHYFYHFILSLLIFYVGGSPFYISLLQKSYFSTYLIKINLIESILTTFTLYYFCLKSWSSYTHHNIYMVDLVISSDDYHEQQIKRTLKQLGIEENNDLINMLHIQGYKINFLNSFKVRQLLREYYNQVNTLKQQLKKFVRVQKLQLNISTDQLTMSSLFQQTLRFCFPVALIVSQFLIYSIITQINEISDIDQNVNTLIGWSTVVGVISVIHFVMQHWNQVFYRDSEGQIKKRITVKKDLIKITILALLMMTVFIVSIVGGFLIAQKNGWNPSLRFLTSLGAGLVGFIISVLIHVIWNKNCSIQGIIIKPAI